jgi:uncharacterized protein (TIGR02145 family)
MRATSKHLQIQGRSAKHIFILQMHRNIVSLFKRFGRRVFQCYVKSDSSYITKTDKLYNWPAVNDPRGLTPKGWHVPSKLEWEKLIEYLGGTNIAGKKLKSKKGWASNVNVKNGNGNNVSGFNAYPAFWRHAQGKMHEILGFGAYFWSTTEIDEEFKYENDAWTFNLFALTDQAIIRLENKPYGLAVRCIKD